MRRPMLTAMLVAALAAAAPGAQALAEDLALRITDAWARPTIPARPGAGYFTLVNAGDETDTLVSAEAEGAESVKIHMTDEQLGVVEMLVLESLEVTPGEEVVFAPGEKHLMFTGLAEPLAEGEVFPATLVFEKAGEIEVEFTVREEPPAGSGENDGEDEEAD